MKISRGFLRVFLLAGIIFLQASPGMARPNPKPDEAEYRVLLPIVLKKFAFGNGTVTGRVINGALPDTNVPGAQVCWGSNCVLSDQGGTYTLENVPSGDQILTASADGFIANQVRVHVVGNTTVYQDIAIIPEVFTSGLKYRILTTWDKTPCWPDPNGVDCWANDLDVHMWLEPAPMNYHIGYYYHYNPENEIEEYWLDKGDCYGLFPNACLERDAQYGYGPETIAIKQLQPDTIYYFGVINYNQGQPGVPLLSHTSAQVRLYDLTGLSHTFEVPQDAGDQNFWYVFKIDHTVEPPIITTMNCIIGYSNDPPQCP